MKLKNKNILFTLVSMLFVCSSAWSQNGKAFTVILDAGHGGKDPGNSYHGFVEKEISLATTMKVGKLLENYRDIRVIYTRTSDVFIELANRPKIANKANADLFVSIHCNSVTNQTPAGTETFVMGLSRTDMNLEVAKNENSVILLEDNYKKTYKGFDPNKPESMIGRVIIQEENLNSSIALASVIQDNFTNNLNRKTRGVKQQPLWVLDAATMPGVLIELGFLSNKEEGEFLNSDDGQNKMANQIADAIVKYKREYFNEGSETDEVTYVEKIEKKEAPDTSVVKVDESPAPESNGFYKIQLFASSKRRALTSPDFKGLGNISYSFENNLYKYYYGKSSDLNEAKRLYQEAKSRGFKDAFIVTTINGKTSAIK